MTRTIETERLRLRAPRMDDAARMAEYLADFEVAGNLSRVPHPYTLAHATTWLANWRTYTNPANTRFVIDSRDDGAIGQIGFRDDGGTASIGYWLGQAYWGHGLMTEALTAVLRWYFDVTDAEEVQSGIFHFNMPSLAIQQKLGFVETGRSNVHCLARSEDVEHIDTELTRDAFEVLDARMTTNMSLHANFQRTNEKTAT